MSMLKKLAILAATVGLTATAFGQSYNRGHDYYETGQGSWQAHVVVAGSVPEMPAYEAGRGRQPIPVYYENLPTARRVVYVAPAPQVKYIERWMWNTSTQSWVKALIRVQ